jgi:hypothetical protein
MFDYQRVYQFWPIEKIVIWFARTRDWISISLLLSSCATRFEDNPALNQAAEGREKPHVLVQQIHNPPKNIQKLWHYHQDVRCGWVESYGTIVLAGMNVQDENKNVQELFWSYLVEFGVWPNVNIFPRCHFDGQCITPIPSLNLEDRPTDRKWLP